MAWGRALAAANRRLAALVARLDDADDEIRVLYASRDAQGKLLLETEIARDEWAEVYAVVERERDAAVAERDALRAAVERVLADEESQPGAWGPDVTMVAVLRAALARAGAAGTGEEET